MSDPERKLVATMIGLTQEPPGKEVQALMTMMDEWLMSSVRDKGTPVEGGGGYGQCDLYVFFGGLLHSINLSEKWVNPAKDPLGRKCEELMTRTAEWLRAAVVDPDTEVGMTMDKTQCVIEIRMGGKIIFVNISECHFQEPYDGPYVD